MEKVLSAATKPKSKSARVWQNIWRRKTNYLFILPALIWFAIFCYVPMGGLIIVFKEYSYRAGIWGSGWATPLFKYFEMFFDNPMMGEMLRNTVLISCFKLLFGFPAPIILALMLNEVRNKHFKKFVQTVTYFPFFISWVVVMTMLDQLLTPYGAGGPIYNVIKLLGGSEEMAFYLVDSQYFFPLVIGSHVWKTIGWNSIIYLAAITNVNPDLYEAGRIDGAGRLRMIWSITLPSIAPTIGILFILSLGSLVSAGYEQIYLMQQPTNFEWSNILDVFIIEEGLNKGRYSLASVGGLLQGVFGLVLIVGGNLALKKTAGISLW